LQCTIRMKARQPYISIIILIISFFVTQPTFAEPSTSHTHDENSSTDVQKMVLNGIFTYATVIGPQTALILYLHGKDKKKKNRRLYKKNKKLATQLLASSLLLRMISADQTWKLLFPESSKEQVAKVKKQYEEKQRQLEEKYKHPLNSYENEYNNATYEPATNLGSYRIVKIE